MAKQYAFGSGQLFARTTGNSTPTPVQFGALQDVSIEFTHTSKPLFGRYQFPLAVGRGTGKVTGKAKFAQIQARAYNDLFFGYSSLGAGQIETVSDEAQTISSNIATSTNAANFISALGVVRANDGTPYTRVSATPTGTQYTCNESNGVYAFNSSQNAVPVLLSYTYNNSASGARINLTNQLLGNSPTFMAVFTQTYNSQQMTFNLTSCMSNKLTFASQLEDWTIPEFEFECFVNDAGTLGSLSFDN